MKKATWMLLGLVLLAMLAGCETTENCARSWDCQNFGFCTRDGKRCVVGSDEDCRRATICTVHGKCKARDGKCVEK